MSILDLDSTVMADHRNVGLLLSPADAIGGGLPGETFRVLKEKEQAKFGEYRTRRLVLEAWDRLP